MSQIENNKELVKVWSKIVMLIVSILAWRIWQNINPSRDNLFRRGILVESQNSCLLDYGKEESVDHIFFECLSTVLAWSEVLGWLNISYVSHNSALQNFVHFAGICSGDHDSQNRDPTCSIV